MEAVFFRLHERFATTAVRLLPRKVRRYMEYVSLLNAICLLTTLFYLHRNFVNPKIGPDQCLPTALRRAGVDPSKVHVLQIHLEQRQPTPPPPDHPHCELPPQGTWLGDAGAAGSCVPAGGAPPPSPQSLLPFKYYSIEAGTGRDAVGTTSGPGTLTIETAIGARQAKEGGGSSADSGSGRGSRGGGSGERDKRSGGIGAGGGEGGGREGGTGPTHGSEHKAEAGTGTGTSWYVPDKVYLFSLEKGFLMLRQDLRARHDIVATNVTVPIWDDCFGTPLSKSLLEHIIGYDTVVMNWLISLYNGKGFLYSVSTKELFNLNYADEFLQSTEDWDKYVVFKVGVLFTTIFLFFTTTTLVSFTLRETQERMLRFTFLLQHHIRNRLPYAPLIFTHVVESLVFVPIMVGILFFLFEFFSDQLLAFMVLSVVWMCEVYSVISVRTITSIRFFPRMVFFYFALFHIYFFSFPFGFSYLALVATVLFLQHSMLFFWNRCEVPALQSRQVSINNPRMGGVISIRAMAPPPPNLPPQAQPRAPSQAAAAAAAAAAALDSQWHAVQWHAAHPGAADPSAAAAVVDDLYHTRTPVLHHQHHQHHAPPDGLRGRGDTLHLGPPAAGANSGSGHASWADAAAAAATAAEAPPLSLWTLMCMPWQTIAAATTERPMPAHTAAAAAGQQHVHTGEHPHGGGAATSPAAYRGALFGLDAPFSRGGGGGRVRGSEARTDGELQLDQASAQQQQQQQQQNVPHRGPHFSPPLAGARRGSGVVGSRGGGGRQQQQQHLQQHVVVADEAGAGVVGQGVLGDPEWEEQDQSALLDFRNSFDSSSGSSEDEYGGGRLALGGSDGEDAAAASFPMYMNPAYRRGQSIRRRFDT